LWGVLLFAVSAATAAGEEGLVACYRFDEGQGTTLHNRSGHGNHGIIHGASWVPSGSGFALRFDGVDDYVDCGSRPSLDVSRAVSLEAWIYPEATPTSGEPGVLGKCFGSYLFTYYTNGCFYWYITGGGNHVRAPAAVGAWHHVVGTFDGKFVKLYLDGVLAGTRESKTTTIAKGVPLQMATSASGSKFTKGKYFQGMLTEVRIYDRALSAEEVDRHYHTTRLTGEIAVRPYLYASSGTLVVDADLRALGELPVGALLRVEFFAPGSPTPLAASRVLPSPSSDAVEVCLTLGELAPGEYELRASVVDRQGQPIGKTTRSRVKWPARPRWKDAPDAKVLNNLVAELLNVTALPRRTKARFQFVNPREGWIFISSRAGADAADPISLALDGQPVHAHTGPGTLEAMRMVSKGPHQLQLSTTAGLDRLVVRAIPELVFVKFGPEIVFQDRRARRKLQPNEAASYDWDFLQKHVLPHINVLVGSGEKDQEPFLREWKSQGKRWLVECAVPGFITRETVTADRIEEYLLNHVGFINPEIDGVLGDEFGGGEHENYAAWTEAMRRIRDNEKLKHRLFYPYCGSMHGAKASRNFIQTVMDAGWRFAFERYLTEQRTERATRAFIDARLRRPIASWREAMPGVEQHMIVNIGTFCRPPESLDVNPALDYKVYLDMQLNLLANDPACFGLYGVMAYLSTYTNEETVRWMGKLFRHYCIEGKGEPFCKDPLALAHVRNPDFEEGTSGWTVTAAEPGSVAARKSIGFSWLQGRYPRTSQGETVLWMKRSSRCPNVVSQPVGALQPGRLYALRMYSGDYQDLSLRRKHAISIELDDVDVLPERSFHYVFPNCYSHHHGPFDRERLAWMNYHRVVFRARGEQATLKISDWSSPVQPGGPTGQELMMNFVQIQPYEE